MADGVRVVLDKAGLKELLEGSTGPVAAELLRTVTRVETAAKRLAPVDTGRLRSSITHAIDRDGDGLVGIVGSDVDYAVFVELGTSRAAAKPFLRPALAAELTRRATRAAR